MKKVLNIVLFCGFTAYCVFKARTLPLVFIILATVGLALIIEELFIRKWDVTLLAALGITYVFLDITFQKVSWNYLVGFVRDVQWAYMVPMFVIVFLAIGIRTLKWRFLFREQIGLKYLAEATFIGFLANTLLPARLGEFVRVFILADRRKLPVSQVLVTVAIDRVFDGVALITFFILLFFTAPFAREKFIIYSLIGTGVYAAVLLAVILYYVFNRQINRFVVGLAEKVSPKAAARTGEILGRIVEGMHLFRNFGSFILFILLSLCVWWLNYAGIVVLCQSCGLISLFHIQGVSLFVASLLFLVLLSLAVAIPAGPGGAGPYQYVLSFALIRILNPAIAKSDILVSKAAGFSIYLWICQALPIVVFGIIFMMAGGYTLRSLEAGRKMVK